MTAPGSATRIAGAAGLVGAVLASACCILPLVLIFSGVAGASVMMSMMRYEWFTLPAGVLGLAAGWVLYVRQLRRCRTEACTFVGRRANAMLLGLATVVVVVALVLKIFPSWSAALLEAVL